MIANPEVYVVSPNREIPTRTWNPIEVIENYIAKVPEIDVKFGAWTDEQEGPLTFSLSTSMAATLQDSAQIAITMGTEMDGIAKLIGDELKNYGYKSVIDRLSLDVNPGMYKAAGPNANGQRLAMYTVEGVYNLSTTESTPGISTPTAAFNQANRGSTGRDSSGAGEVMNQRGTRNHARGTAPAGEKWIKANPRNEW